LFFSRYRFPLIPIGILFAAAGIINFRQQLGHLGRSPVWRWAIGGALLTAVVVNWPTEGAEHDTALTYGNLGLQLMQDDKLDSVKRSSSNHHSRQRTAGKP
jgi:hypothetical protein